MSECKDEGSIRIAVILDEDASATNDGDRKYLVTTRLRVPRRTLIDKRTFQFEYLGDHDGVHDLAASLRKEKQVELVCCLGTTTFRDCDKAWRTYVDTIGKDGNDKDQNRDAATYLQGVVFPCESTTGGACILYAAYVRVDRVDFKVALKRC